MTLTELVQAPREEWENIPKETFQNLTRMQPMLQAVIEARSGNTRY